MDGDDWRGQGEEQFAAYPEAVNLSTGLVIGRVRGIEIRIHLSWLLIFALLAWTLSSDVFGDLRPRWSEQARWAVGIGTTLAFFASVLIHELSHAVVAQRYGMQVPSITLFIFGGVSNLSGEMKSAGQEFRVAIAGPLVSWSLALLFAAVWFLMRSADAAVIPQYLALINAALGLFNLLPGFPLDGGRVLRAALWARSHDLLRATCIAARTGMVVGYLMIVVGGVTIFTFGEFSGLWYVLIGLFLRSAAAGSYQTAFVESALSDVVAADVMSLLPQSVPASLSLQRFAEERLAVTPDELFLVEEEGAVVGLIAAAEVMVVPYNERASKPVSAQMVPVNEIISVERDAPAVEELATMQTHNVHHVPVLDDGRVIGMVAHTDLLRRAELDRRSRGEDAAGGSG